MNLWFIYVTTLIKNKCSDRRVISDLVPIFVGFLAILWQVKSVLIKYAFLWLTYNR